MASIAINGLGRVGRAALKIIDELDGAEVVAVNDLIPPDNLAYLLRYDTVYGHWHKTVAAAGDLLVMDARADLTARPVPRPQTRHRPDRPTRHRPGGRMVRADIEDAIRAIGAQAGSCAHRQINIGLAVAIEEGLIVPAIRDADRKTFTEIAREAHDLTARPGPSAYPG